MARSILNITPGKVENETVEKDTEDIILFFLASGIQQVRIEAANLLHMYFIFNVDEIRELEAQYFSGAPLMIDFRRVLEAKNRWKEALSMLRNIRESARTQKKTETVTTSTSEVAVVLPTGN